jgi:mannose PTS system EIIA component
MIGVLIIGHDTLPESLAQAATHVLGSRPEQFEVLPVTCDDDPLDVLPRAKDAIAKLDTGEGVVVFSDIYGATPCNLVGKLIDPGHVEAVAGVNLPMLVRALTYRTRGLDTMVRKAVSGGCEGVLHLEVDPRYAAARG